MNADGITFDPVALSVSALKAMRVTKLAEIAQIDALIAQMLRARRGSGLVGGVYHTLADAIVAAPIILPPMEVPPRTKATRVRGPSSAAVIGVREDIMRLFDSVSDMAARDVAQALSLERALTHWHLLKLLDAGRLQRTEDRPARWSKANG